MIEQTNYISEDDYNIRMERKRYFFEGVADALYRSEPLDSADLMNCMEELSALLEVELPGNELQVRPVPYRDYKI